MLLLAILIAYLFGSIPTGLILTRLAGYGDIRSIGSGNIGATNVMRTGNKWLGIATLVLDFAKGYIGLALANHLCPDAHLAMIPVLGHVFPVWLKFKGGKGVATAMGSLSEIEPAIGFLLLLFWAGIFAITRISSASALGAFFIVWALLTAATLLFNLNISFYFEFFAIMLLLFFTHRENINRLLAGTEHKWVRK